MKKVLFINGNDKRIAELFQQIAPPDFSVVCISNKDSEEQQALLVAETDYLVLHPAVLSEKLLKAGVNLKLDHVVILRHSDSHSYEEWSRQIRFAWENIRRIE